MCDPVAMVESIGGTCLKLTWEWGNQQSGFHTKWSLLQQKVQIVSRWLSHTKDTHFAQGESAGNASHVWVKIRTICVRE